MKKRYVRQGGSALVYALVAVVLIVVLAGGLYAVRQYDTGSEIAKNDSPLTSEEKQPATDQPSDDKEGGQAPVASSDRGQEQQQTDTSPQMLPVTGPALDMGQLLAIMALAFGLTSYITSRRARWTSREK